MSPAVERGAEDDAHRRRRRARRDRQRGRDPRLHGRRQDRHRAEAGRPRTATRPAKYVASFVGMVPVDEAAARRARDGRRAARRDLRRRRRRAGVRRRSRSSTCSTWRCRPISQATRRPRSPVPGTVARFPRMHLERFIAALGPIEVANAAPLEIAELAYDTRAVPAGIALLLRARAIGRRARVRGRRPSARGARGARRRAPRRRRRCRSSSSPSVRAAMPVAAAALLRRPDARARRRRRHRHERQDDVGVPPRTRSSRPPGGSPALLTNIERRVGGELRPTGLNTPEAIDLQRLFREMLDAGDRSCVMEATSIAQAQGRLDGTRFAVLVFTNLTQDHLDFHGSMEEYFEAKRALFEQAERAVVNVGDEWGARLAAELPGARHVRRRIDALDGIDLQAARRASTARTRSARRWRRARSASTRTRSGAGSSRSPACPGRFESIDEGQPFAVIVDYAHTPDSLENVLRAARDARRGRLIVVFGAGGDRDRDEAAADGPGRRRARRPRDPHLRQPALARIPPRSRPRSPPARSAARDRARPARRDRAGARGRASGRRRRDRRQRRRAEQELADRQESRSTTAQVAREVLRRWRA